MKDLKFICAQPDDFYYLWQTHLWLESLRNIGKSDRAIVLLYTPSYRPKNEKWYELVALYPEAEFVFYKDDENVAKWFSIYIPILRPYCLKKYFAEHPEMKDKAVLYCDNDVIFNKNFNIDAYINDDINYLSNTNGYINASYFDSKIKDVIPEKKELYETRDILNEVTELVGINRQVAEQHNLHSGGAQYLLKNIDDKFWEKVYVDTLTIRKYLMATNRQFFTDENKGFQSWCADMWGVLWNLWYRNQEAKVIPEMDFAWSSDPIEKLEKTGILHNAGIVSENMGDYLAFYKGKYHSGLNPFNDPNLQNIYNDERSKKYCNHFYLSQLLELKNKYNNY
jgi:hypothetical protein